MKTYSLDLRHKIVETYDRGGISQQDLAERFCVSIFFVKKLFRQRRLTGTIAPLAKNGWQKGLLTAEMQDYLISLYKENKKIKLKEIAARIEEKFSVRLSKPTISRAIKKLNLKARKKEKSNRVKSKVKITLESLPEQMEIIVPHPPETFVFE